MMSDDRLYFTVDELFRAYERARLLERVLDHDPADIDALRAYAEMVSGGLDVADPVLVHGFTLADAQAVRSDPDATVRMSAVSADATLRIVLR